MAVDPKCTVVYAMLSSFFFLFFLLPGSFNLDGYNYQ